MGKYEAIADFVTEKDGQMIEVEKIDLNQPRVFVFHGALATNLKEAQDALSETKRFFEDMGVSGYQFLATYYTRKTLLGFLRYQKATEKEKDAILAEFKQAIVPVFEDILLPLMVQNGKALSKEQIIANMNKVILRGHCMGSLLVTNLGNLYRVKLSELGFSDEDIEEITKHGKAIFSSSIVLPHEIDGNYEIYSFINLGDNELFKYAGEDWRANLMYMTGAKHQPDEPIYHTLQANNIRFVLLSSHLDNAAKEELEQQIKEAVALGDKAKVRKYEKVLLGHAWSLITRPYKDLKGVTKAYDIFKQMVKKALEN